MHRLPLVVRGEWGAKKAKATVKLKHPIRKICFCWNPGVPTCDNQEDCMITVKKMQSDHMKMGLMDIHYNFIVGGDGLIYEGRGWRVRSAKSRNTPKTHGLRLDIGYIGNEKVDPFQPPHKQCPPALKLIHYGVNYKFIVPIYDVFKDSKPIEHTPSPDDDINLL
ncbi:peptidoglycan recognition protein 1-like [Macrosteles quadrilineatus]|uniref:peptidoglycan recognition protein 1-like n=1 Tax=Macrosteles quadrilineatus TaxID=74068 RepID=UPI0023E0A6DF|nr:peptidoglycan recognition protein 1-like [Macrosteles quadrilineatus]